MAARERREWFLAGQLAADELRLSRGIGTAPISDLWQFIEDEPDLALAFHEFPNGGDGVYRWNGERGIIVLNLAVMAFGRRRFTGAHELGHHIMHRDGHELLEIADKNVLQAKDQRLEVEANAFAAHLLAPTAAMREAFPQTPSSLITVDDIVELMIEYGLSFRTAVFRLHNADRITYRDRDRLMEESYAQVGWSLRAKGHRDDPRRPTNLPSTYTAKVLSLHSRGILDDARLAELLGLDLDAARELVAEVDADPGGPPTSLGSLGDMLDAGLARLRDEQR